jgi:hypothetical protein
VTDRGAKERGRRTTLRCSGSGGEMEHLPQLGEVFGGEMAREHVARELQDHLAAAAASLEF